MVSVEICKLMCSFIKHTTYELHFCRIKSMNSPLSYRVLRIRLSRRVTVNQLSSSKNTVHQFKGSTASILLQLCISKQMLIHSYQKFLHQKRREKDIIITNVDVHACTVHAYTYTHVPYMCTRTRMYCICVYVYACTIHVHT